MTKDPVPSAPEEPSSMSAEPSILGSAPTHSQQNTNGQPPNGAKGGLVGWVKNMFAPKPDTTLREAIEEYIEEPQSYEDVPTISAEERAILSNILSLQHITVLDVMVPRADIIALELGTKREELFALLAEKQFSRIPVFKDNLDDVVGTIHIKDIMAALAKNEDIVIGEMLTDIPIVSPSLSILDLVIKMRQSRRHMVMVVDEYGGIDGLVTIGDVIESIIGEIDDEHDTDEDHEIVVNEDGSILADGRVDIDDFEERFGRFFSDEERQDSDTLGGIVCDIAGRVPARGEILMHKAGLRFEVLDADPRRVNRLKISQMPQSAE